MNFLGRHVALRQQKRTASPFVLSHVDHDHSVARVSAVDEHVADLHAGGIPYRDELALQGGGSGIGEDRVQVAAEVGVAAVRPGPFAPGYPVAPDLRTEAAAPVPPARQVAAGEMESDLVAAASREQVLGPKPHHGIRALLQIPVAHVDVHHRHVCGLVGLELTVVQVHRRSAGLQR